MTVGNLQLALGIDKALIAKQPDFLAALNLCADLSGKRDELIAAELEIAPSQWSRIRSGQANFPPNKLLKFMEICGNEVPLAWLALQRHYELMPTMSAMEKIIADKDAEIAEMHKKQAHFEEFLQRMRQ